MTACRRPILAIDRATRTGRPLDTRDPRVTTLSAMLSRLNRLFAADGRCFDVAVDHGFFNEGSFLAGIEDMARAVSTLVAAGPDAIQLSPGQAHLLQDVPGPGKPALVLRTDVANVYHPELPGTLYSEVIEDAVGTAVR